MYNPDFHRFLPVMPERNSSCGIDPALIPRLSDNMAPETELPEQEYREELADIIAKMMFVSGETAEPSPETTTIIEEIVHTQVVEMV